MVKNVSEQKTRWTEKENINFVGSKYDWVHIRSVWINRNRNNERQYVWHSHTRSRMSEKAKIRSIHWREFNPKMIRFFYNKLLLFLSIRKSIRCTAQSRCWCVENGSSGADMRRIRFRCGFDEVDFIFVRSMTTWFGPNNTCECENGDDGVFITVNFQRHRTRSNETSLSRREREKKNMKWIEWME